MIEFKDNGGKVIELPAPININEGSKRKFLLMKEDYITLRFSLEKPFYFKLGDRVEIPGDTTQMFELCDLYKPTYNETTGGYDYDLHLDAYYWKWKNKKFFYRPEQAGCEASWGLMTDLKTHMEVFLKNLEKLGYFYKKDEAFGIGKLEVEESAKYIQYDNVNLLDALSQMAETWGCEWWITGSKINFGRCEFGDPVDFELGVNVNKMSRSDSQSNYATRIYAFGSTRNLPATYRKKLIFDVKEVSGRRIADTSRKLEAKFFPDYIVHKEEYYINSKFEGIPYKGGAWLESTDISDKIEGGIYKLSGSGLEFEIQVAVNPGITSPPLLAGDYDFSSYFTYQLGDKNEVIKLGEKTINIGNDQYYVNAQIDLPNEISIENGASNFGIFAAFVIPINNRGGLVIPRFKYNFTVKKGVSADISVTFVSGLNKGDTFQSVYNPEFLFDELSNVIELPEGVTASVGDRFTIDNLIRSKVTDSYFTKDDAEVAVNGIVQKRLMLPESESCVNAYGGEMPQEEAVEDIVIFEDIYPKFDGIVEEAFLPKTETDTNENEAKYPDYSIRDIGLTYFPEEARIEDKLHVVFQTGKLIGHDFVVNIKSSDASGTVFKIVPNKDYNLPDETLRPWGRNQEGNPFGESYEGDRYILFGFDPEYLSDSMIPNAEDELLKRAKQYVEKSKIDPSTYNCTMFSQGAYNNGDLYLYEVGDRVNLKNEVYFENGRLSRIIGYEFNLDMPYDNPVYIVGETAPYSRIGELESKVDSLIYKGLTYNGGYIGGGSAGSGSSFYLITRNDSTPPSDKNAFSAKRTLEEIRSLALRKDAPDETNYLLSLLQGLVVEQGISADSLLVKSESTSDSLSYTLVEEDGLGVPSSRLIEETNVLESVSPLIVEEAAIGSNLNINSMWFELGDGDNPEKQISMSHLANVKLWMTNKDFITSEALTGYATELWVTGKGYLVATAADKGNWNTAFAQSHSHVNKTLLDSIVADDVNHWRTAYGWGNHALAGYATQTWVENKKYITAAALSDYVTKSGTGASGTWAINISGNAATSTRSTYSNEADKATLLPQQAYSSVVKPNAHNLRALALLHHEFAIESGSNMYSALSIDDCPSDVAVGKNTTEVWQIASSTNTNVMKLGMWYRKGINTTWSDWIKLLDSSNYKDYTVSKSGEGATGTWDVNISGASQFIWNGNNNMQFRWLNNGSNPTYLWGSTTFSTGAYLYQPSVITVGNANFVTIQDVRDTNRGPDDWANFKMTAWFNNVGTPTSEWYGGIVVKGWSDNYRVWQLASSNSSIADANPSLYFRNGVVNSWNAWREILDTINYTSYIVPKTGGSFSGDVGISGSLDVDSIWSSTTYSSIISVNNKLTFSLYVGEGVSYETNITSSGSSSFDFITEFPKFSFNKTMSVQGGQEVTGIHNAGGVNGFNVNLVVGKSTLAHSGIEIVASDNVFGIGVHENDKVHFWGTSNGTIGSTTNKTYFGYVNLNSKSFDWEGRIRTNNVVSAGEYTDDSYGYINVCRPDTAGSFSCFSFVRTGVVAFGLGYNSNNQIILGAASNSKSFNEVWLKIDSSSIKAQGFAKNGSNNNYALTGDGSHLAISTENVGNTLVKRYPSGDIIVRYVYSETPNNENSTPVQFVTTNGTGNYYCKSSAKQVNSYLSNWRNYDDVIDLSSSGYDQNKWYPCVVHLRSDLPVTIKIWNTLDGNSHPSWGTHERGFTLNLTWTVTGSGWGATVPQRTIYNNYYNFTSVGKSPCGGIEQNTSNSDEIVYLRGGGRYCYNVSTGETFTIYSNGYNFSSGSSSYSAPLITTPKGSPSTSYDRSVIGVEEIYAKNLDVADAGLFRNTLTVDGAALLTDSLTVDGIAKLNSYVTLGDGTLKPGGAINIPCDVGFSAPNPYSVFSIGNSSKHIAFSNEDIQAVNTAVTSTLYLNPQGGNVYMGNSFAGTFFRINYNVAATSTAYGALIVDGGIAIAKNIYVGGGGSASTFVGNLIVNGNTTLNNKTLINNSLTVSGESTFNSGARVINGFMSDLLVIDAYSIFGNQLEHDFIANNGTGVINIVDSNSDYHLAIDDSTIQKIDSNSPLRINPMGGSLVLGHNTFTAFTPNVWVQANSDIPNTIQNSAYFAIGQENSTKCLTFWYDGIQCQDDQMARNLYLNYAGGDIILGNSSTTTSTPGKISINNATSSTSVGTGALTVSGGVGIGGNISIGGSYLYLTNSIQSEIRKNFTNTSGYTALKMYGSNVSNDEYSNLTMNIQSSGTIQFDCNSMYLWVGTGKVKTTGRLQINNSTASTSYTTGALTVSGGVGVGGDIYTKGSYLKHTTSGSFSVQKFFSGSNNWTTIGLNNTFGTNNEFTNIAANINTSGTFQFDCTGNTFLWIGNGKVKTNGVLSSEGGINTNGEVSSFTYSSGYGPRVRFYNTQNTVLSNGYFELCAGGPGLGNEFQIWAYPYAQNSIRIAGFNPNGDMYIYGNLHSNNGSDSRLKKNEHRVDYAQRLLDMGMVFDYEYNDIATEVKAPGADRGIHTGFYHDVVETIMPQMANTVNGYGALNYINTDYINTIAGAVQLNTLGLRDLFKRQETIEEKYESALKRIEELEQIILNN